METYHICKYRRQTSKLIRTRTPHSSTWRYTPEISQLHSLNDMRPYIGTQRCTLKLQHGAYHFASDLRRVGTVFVDAEEVITSRSIGGVNSATNIPHRINANPINTIPFTNTIRGNTHVLKLPINRGAQ